MKRKFKLNIRFTAILSFVLIVLQDLMAQSAHIYTDTLSVIPIPYLQHIDTGANCIWDISEINSDRLQRWHLHTIHYDDNADFLLHMPRKNLYFHKNSDSIYLKSIQDNTHYISFPKPAKIKHIDSLALYDSTTSICDVICKYNHIINQPLCSEVSSVCNGAGTILLPQGNIQAKKQNLNIQYKTTDSTIIAQDVYDLWFEDNSTLPIVIHNKHYVYDNDTTALYTAYIIQQMPIRRSIQKIDVIDSTDNDIHITDIYTNATYTPNPVVGNLTISYTLTRSAAVGFSLHNQQGVPMYVSLPQQQEEDDYKKVIPMHAYPTGTYVLYVFVDDYVIAETIIKI